MVYKFKVGDKVKLTPVGTTSYLKDIELVVSFLSYAVRSGVFGPMYYLSHLNGSSIGYFLECKLEFFNQPHEGVNMTFKFKINDIVEIVTGPNTFLSDPGNSTLRVIKTGILTNYHYGNGYRVIGSKGYEAWIAEDNLQLAVGSSNTTSLDAYFPVIEPLACISHTWQKYDGIFESYNFCTVCDHKDKKYE